MYYRVLDLFSGCGGLSYGFRKAGYNIIGGIDYNQDCVNTFAINFKTKLNFCGDISKITDDEVALKYQNVDVVIGGPPCQGFSSANMWQKDIDDERNKLFLDFVRFIKVIKPKAFLMENVAQVLSKGNGEVKKKLELFLQDQYYIDNKILFANDYGVPQKRKRNFFIGINKNYESGFNFDYIKSKDKVSVGEAISDLYDVENKKNSKFSSKPLSKYQKEMRLKSKDLIHNHEPQKHNEKVVKRIKLVPEGGNWKDVPEELWDTIRNNRHSSAYKRLNSNDASVTIDCGHMNYFHPKFNRVPTVRESARLQSFPDDFIFTGSKGSQLKQVGNAVPPLLSYAIAKVLKSKLDEI